MSIYRTPADIPPEPPPPPKPCAACYEVCKRESDGKEIVVRRGYHWLITGTYGAPDERWAYVCDVCGDQWQ